jgi:hypothetical protein
MVTGEWDPARTNRNEGNSVEDIGPFDTSYVSTE